MIPVILSGGSGSRLWPISRTSFPKQFCDILDESLLTKTLKRFWSFGAPYIVTVKTLKVLTDGTVSSLNLPQDHVLYEPSPRNTAAAVALICWKLQQQGKFNEVVGVFPADHLIIDEKKFLHVVEQAEQCALAGGVVTLGIAPTSPATGFGYIECDMSSAKTYSNQKAYRVLGFREKPDLATAENFLKQKNFFWNAGMFIFKLQTMINAFEKHMPELWQKIQNLKSDLSNLESVYSSLPQQSIDYGIMEKLDDQMCIPADFGWSDLGSWDDFAQIMQASGKETTQAEVFLVKSENNFVFSQHPKTIGMVNVKDIIVIDTPDALLIAKKGSSQDLKQLVDLLNKNKNKKAEEHLFDHRPWGKYEILCEDPQFKVKAITVNPQAQLSYQSHDHRSENWIVIEGSGEVILDEKTIPVVTGSSIFIPRKSKHRIRNTSQKPLRFVEVQTGSYFGEDDITRYADDYSRA